MERGRVAAERARRLAVLLPFVQVLLPLVQILALCLLDAGGFSVSVALAATTAAGAALLTCALVAARCAPVVAPQRVRTAIRERDRRTAFLPQRDPDAKGRIRPRAPGLVASATVVA
ncbi:DUF6412 domain-containing protein [Streptomyces sp. 15-116A]|uniref:DUF6412 domain-containing protein n=1 Tax=Streptomyces sp. 15-116A TaxID=2259035 RepID=UPI0037D9D5FA